MEMKTFKARAKRVAWTGIRLVKEGEVAEVVATHLNPETWVEVKDEPKPAKPIKQPNLSDV